MFRRISLLFVLLVAQLAGQTYLSQQDWFILKKTLKDQLTVDTTSVPNAWQYSWIGSPGSYYFAQMSTDLVNWTPLTGYTATGTGSRVGVNVSMDNLPIIFFRLAILDPSQPMAPSEDTDGNGLPDVWEVYFYGQPGNNPNAISASGLTNLDAFRLGSNPAAGTASDTGNLLQLNITQPQ